MLLGILLRLLCYSGLLLIIAALIAFGIVSDHCPQMSTGSISCDTIWATDLAHFVMTVTLITAFTGIPLLLAVGGLVFLIRAVRAWRRRRREKDDRLRG